ncbi:MAG TPA: alpha/beta fold hydrolase [Acidimicrobiales bacterium]|jgi:2-succinyl-6-hydroxy-2,4-cyclohexadiene-1-carboxylate synthase|nr:alpha/beta fold hydrolase [Acidimicrobiales bacterium]
MSPDPADPAEPAHPVDPADPADAAAAAGPDTPGLHATAIGHGPRLVMAHGFTQTGNVWGTLDILLAADYQVVRADMPGHGGSGRVRADLTEGARRLGALGGRASYLGYSMGARFCLHLALDQPELVDSLILVSGTAGIEDPGERAARRAADDRLADQLDPPLPGSHPIDEPDADQARLDSFLHRWLDIPLLAGVPTEANGFAERRRNTGPGLASSLRLAGTGTQLPLWEQLGGLAMPVLVITGERDDKFTTIGGRMVDAIGENATQAVVARAGHSPHLEHPTRVAEVIRTFLGSHR